MPYVIAEPCIDVKDKACVEVCPVDLRGAFPGESQRLRYGVSAGDATPQVQEPTDFRTHAIARTALRSYEDLGAGHGRGFSVQRPTLLPPPEALAGACSQPARPRTKERTVTNRSVSDSLVAG